MRVRLSVQTQNYKKSLWLLIQLLNGNQLELFSLNTSIKKNHNLPGTMKHKLDFALYCGVYTFNYFHIFIKA